MTDSKNLNAFELRNTSTSKQANHVTEMEESGDVLSSTEQLDLPEDVKIGFTPNDQRDMHRMGKQQEFRV